MVLDPESNPSLFNSTLAIIIKDVTDSDSKDIVKEFSLKFQKIVQKEQEQNSISRLHRGRVQIIPWPVINSTNFYMLFNHLRRYLDTQTITHLSGGIFLHNMKTLMAKIKASDWGSLDQNLATHRAQQLDRGLHIALSRGSTDQGDLQTPLKNLDTDEDVPLEGPDVFFFVPDISGTIVQGDEEEMEKVLDVLIRSCLASSRIGPRHITGDNAHIESLQQQLFELLDQRLEHVRCWFQINVQRFPENNQDIRNVYSKIDGMALVMCSAVRLCAESCSTCHYLYTRPQRHSGSHECGTEHSCPFSCEASEDHPVSVGLQVIVPNICATSEPIRADRLAILLVKPDAPDLVSSHCTTRANIYAPHAYILAVMRVVCRT
ncbi:unnamed protein product [Rhizoctonia solani]|nr:unnamed protein product [Rhizoctonia solani]